MEVEEKAKYIVEINLLPRAKKVSKETLEEVKGAIGGKRLARMKKEGIECPVLKQTVSFLECFPCKNFLRRIRGKVECAGSEL